MSCYLRTFAPEGYRQCDGPMQRHHWVKQQTIKRLFPRLPLGATDDEIRERKRRLNAALNDERNIDLNCKRHHDLHEKAKRIPLTRDQLPEGLEEFAADYGLEYALDLQFGPLGEAAFTTESERA